MNNRGSYSQKKKKEALRRLSQSGARGVRTSRNVLHEETGGQGKDAKEKRREQEFIKDDRRSPRRGLFGGRRVVASDSPSSSSHLVIHADLRGQSFGTDTPDTELDYTRRVVTSKVSSNSPAVGLFGTVSDTTAPSGIFTSDSTKTLFGKPVAKNPFTDLSKEASSSQESSASLLKHSEDTLGLDSVTRNLFGKPTLEISEPPSLFGKPQDKSDQTSLSSTKDLFGKEADKKHKEQEQSKSTEKLMLQTHTLFGKIPEQLGRRHRQDFSSKRHLSPDKAETASKRILTKFDSPFSSDSQSDITDLETFGADTTKSDSRQRKPIIKPSGLFKKAIAEASSGKEDSPRKVHRSRSRSPEERKQILKDRKSWEEQDKLMEEAKPEHRPSRLLSRRRMFGSPEEIKDLTIISVKEIPDEVNTKTFLKNYFTQFGATHVFSNQKKNSAVVHFADHDSAANAKKKIKVLKRGTKPVSVFWRQRTRGSRLENRASQDDKKPTFTRLKDDRTTVSRQLLASSSLRVKTKLNSEDDTTPKAVTQSMITGASMSHPKTSRPSVPAQMLSKKVGLTAQDRLDILEERDKIIRQGLRKKSNLVSSQAIRGTCPDMCPEKERYMRMVQRRLHPYELQSGSTDKVNHDLAVKEYSRSSADQEEPLPHEMRPAPVLTLTMYYLMCHIMDKGQDGYWEEWFDFLWSRTRGIRKDITQQDLRDATAIDLMEKCARFHIFCSHRLCEEDRSTIDPKINNENLTKCMQSLKHFYHDSASEGSVCPNEAEFRAYDVLLNLNERDILRQVQQYRMEVCCSEPVKFALKAFSAVSSNNYVKFFKLVRSTTYLNACIMHRYFTQVRNIALDVMNKAYTISSTKGSRFSLASIQNTLAFDNQSVAAEFCQSHNLTIEDNMVEFSRSAFQQPDIPQAAERSHSVIEAKNTVTIGEVVNGGPLPIDIVHKATSSFDENGKVKDFTIVTVDKDNAGLVTKSVASFEKQGASKPAVVSASITQYTEKPPYSKAEVKEVARGIFLDVIDEMVHDLSSNFMGRIHLVQTESKEVLRDTIEGALPILIREIVEDVCKEEKGQQRRRKAALAELDRQRHLKELEMEEQRRRQVLLEKQRMIEQEAWGIVEEMVNMAVEKEIRVIVTEEIRFVQEQLNKETLERCTSELHQELVDEAVASACRLVADEVIQTQIELREQRLAECKKVVMLGRMARYLERWQRVYAKRIKLKQTLVTFPAAPPNQTASQQLQVLWPGRLEGSEASAGHGRGDVSLDSPFSIISGHERITKSILRIHYLKNVRHQQAWSPLDLPSMLSYFQSHHAPGEVSSHHGNRQQQQQQHHYWKLVASLPSDGSSLLCDWLKAKLKRGKVAESVRKQQLGDDDKIATLSLYSSRVSHVSVRQPCTLSVCTKVITGSLHLAKQHKIRNQLLGTSGILFVLDSVNANENYWHQAQTRLESILCGKPTSPPVPLLIVLFGCSATEHAQNMCIEGLCLRQLLEMGAVSAYHFVGITDVEDPENSTELGESLKWLASRCPSSPLLSEDSFKGYLDTGMTNFFSSRLYEDVRLRRDAGLPEQDCHHVIDLYNATVGHLADVASSSTLTSLSWPPTEFTIADREMDLPSSDWNTRQNVQHLRDKILSLKLPKLSPMHEDDNWSHVCDIIQKYLTSLPGDDKTKAPLFARIHRLLDKCYHTFEDTCFLAFDALGYEPVAGHVPWIKIIEECVDYLMAAVQSYDLDGEEVTPKLVYYIQKEFDNFQVPRSWKEAMNATMEESRTQPTRFACKVASLVKQKQTEYAERQVEATLSEIRANQKPTAPVLDRAPSYVVSATDSAQAVKVMLSSAKEESKKYEDLLQKWLGGIDEGSSLDRMDPLSISETDHGMDKGSSLNGTKSSRAETTDHSGKVPLVACESSLERDLEDLRLNMAAEQRANRLAELRLASLLAL